MARRGNRGLAALADAARLGGPAAPYHLGFLLGPRINAGGRIGDAALGARLLASDDPAEASGSPPSSTGSTGAPGDRDGDAGGGHAPRPTPRSAAARGPAVLVTGEPALASRRRRADRLAAQGPLPPAGDRHRLQPNGIGTGSGRSIAGVDLGHAVRAAVDARHPRQGRRPRHGGRADHRAGAARRAPRLPRRRRSAARVSRSRARRTASPIDAALIGARRDGRADRDGRAGRAVRRRPSRAGLRASRRTASPMPRRSATATCACRSAAYGATIKAIAFRAADTALGRALLGAAAAPSTSPARCRSTSGRAAARRPSASSTRRSRKQRRLCTDAAIGMRKAVGARERMKLGTAMSLRGLCTCQGKPVRDCAPAGTLDQLEVPRLVRSLETPAGGQFSQNSGNVVVHRLGGDRHSRAMALLLRLRAIRTSEPASRAA